MKTIRKLLIANRGEIARRIQRTCRAMGIATVAVFSDADADALFVREADEAIRIGPAPARESYLVVEKIIDACKRSGADALHPGYGFLSERAELADACAQAGVIFVGPSATAMRAMGLKREAKALAAKLGVPVIPGWSGDESPARAKGESGVQDVQAIAAGARGVGFPLLLKASAGGGGKGMRLVAREDELVPAIESAQREAVSAFGDGTLLVERYIEGARHIEIQILGDAHGTVVHLFERECSIQRRHQKIVEESPSPALSPEQRTKMGQSAVTLARAIGYTSAGTVEMVLDRTGAFYFLEVNTRLQVEHPVTELVTGIDLVREQLRIAEGRKLPFAQADLVQRGHAIEVRLYAEDPAAGFLPQTGRLLDFHLAPREGVRVDTGVETGSEVGIHYDPMLAKIIAHGATREDAARRLARCLRDASILGVTTNRALLARILEHDAFLAGDLDTHFLDRHMTMEEAPDAERDREAAVAAALALYSALSPSVLPGVPLGWRNNRTGPEEMSFDAPSGQVTVKLTPNGAARYEIGVDLNPPSLFVVAGPSRAHADSHHPSPELVVQNEGERRRFRVVRDVDRLTDVTRHYVHGARGAVVLVERPRFPRHDDVADAGGCTAPMPGKVIKVLVKAGDAVVKGARLVLLEAMKMEHAVTAPRDGTVERVKVAEGDHVAVGATLVVLAE